jgi:hypothetical protein
LKFEPMSSKQFKLKEFYSMIFGEKYNHAVVLNVNLQRIFFTISTLLKRAREQI